MKLLKPILSFFRWHWMLRQARRGDPFIATRIANENRGSALHG